MKKLPSIYSKIDKKINNNNRVFISSDAKEIIKDISHDNNDSLSIDEKINNILYGNGYSFNYDVEIVTLNKTYKTKIAGKVMNSLLTMDNEIIDISSIKDLKIKNRF